MRPEEVSDDLRIIREVMIRTRRASGGYGGWFMITWGIVWVLGFTATHFLLRQGLTQAINWTWGVLNGIGAAISIWLGVRAPRRQGMRSTVWRAVLLWWVAVAAFDVLFIWLFRLTADEIALLILLSIALSYFLFGLFTHWAISAIGVFLAVLSVAAALLLPAYFNLALAVLGGGVLIASGAWFVRRGG
ncbi:MAG TPA: hypothetical protein ENK08_03925 [Chloroflexi bacterium]|nr:hypothetical protein [Chloroflexota bacterium]